MSPKNRLWNAFVLAALLLIAAACADQPQNTVVDIPTLAVLPSVTPTVTPTDTPEPTITPIPTDTPVPTDTPTATNTPPNTATPLPPTNTPTITYTPSDTPTITETATVTLTPTATLSATPLPSVTPIPSATPNLPKITSYTISQTTVAPNSSLTLTWTPESAGARIDSLTPNRAVVQTISPVTPSGQMSVVVPGNLGRQITYRLVAVRGGQEVTSPLAVIIQCAYPWFFGDQYAPANAGCPRALGAIGDGAYQPFERGLMIWASASGNRIYGLQNEGNLYISYENGYTDNYKDKQPDVPDGLRRPENWFNWMFYKTNAPIGNWESAIGWATARINEGDRTIQFDDSGRFYIDTANGAVYQFSGGDSGTWALIKNPTS